MINDSGDKGDLSACGKTLLRIKREGYFVNIILIYKVV